MTRMVMAALPGMWMPRLTCLPEYTRFHQSLSLSLDQAASSLLPFRNNASPAMIIP